MGVEHVERRLTLPTELWWLVPVVFAETLLVVGYFGITGARPTALRYVVYPFVWINLGLVAVVGTRPRPASRRLRLLAGAVAVGYFVVLAWLSGLLYVETAAVTHTHATLGGWQVTLSAPGWGPRIGYVTGAGHVYFVPYRVVGYVALAYLVFARTLDASASVLSGVVGLGACLSCAFPVVASFAAGALGPSSAALAASSFAFDLSTAAFVLALAVLYWSPGLPRRPGGRG
ncbi:DUF7546 family protein [Halomarina oriensis]|uniref:Uncharacterized protein n=1 Tax=Halomarina oriensis TaxID=671145 RepID=A0A6B0GMF3_9EURY|nr:hypothetical protein [Halomarina oriensis]MWG35924.1 hypothetical protein [Halomarina oriensis]